MPTNRSERSSSPMVKAAQVVLGLTAVGGVLLVFQQLSPKSHKVSEPPPLVDVEVPAEVPLEPLPPAQEPRPSKPKQGPALVAVPESAAAPSQIAIAKIPNDRLGTALMEEKNPERKLEIIRRLENSGLPSVPYAVAVMFPDPDKRVRLEALRVVEATDKENRILTPKIHAVYMYEEDPEVKAVLNRILIKWRPQEEAEYKARQAQAALEKPAQ